MPPVPEQFSVKTGTILEESFSMSLTAAVKRANSGPNTMENSFSSQIFLWEIGSGCILASLPQLGTRFPLVNLLTYT
jgi:hypothetical protein